MPSDLRHIAMVLFVNMTAVYGQVNELSYMVATIGSLQNCDIQVITIFLKVREKQFQSVFLYSWRIVQGICT